MGNHGRHAHLHKRDSLSHVHVPQDKLDSLKAAEHVKSKGSLSHVVAPGSGAAVKGHPVQGKVDVAAEDKKTFKASLSHIHIPDEIKAHHAQLAASGKDSLSHVTPPGKKSGSLSHVKIPDEFKIDNKESFVKNPAKHHGGQSKASTVENKEAFIKNPAKHHNLQGKFNTVVTVESVVYVTPTPTPATDSPDFAGTPPAQVHHQASSAAASQNAAESYANAKSLANRPHTWNPSASRSHAPVSHVVHHSQVPSHAAVTSQPVATSQSSTTSAAVVASSSSIAAMVGHGVHTTRHSSAHIASSSSIAAVSAPAAISSPASFSTPAPQSVDSHAPATGMTGGSKAGLAIGLLLGFALIGGLALYFIRRRKSQTEEAKDEITDEKHGSFFGSNQMAPSDYRNSAHSDSRSTASTAPRLSLRPVTQFLPNIMDSKNADATNEKKSPWERKPVNPFEDAAALNEKSERPSTPQANPFDEGDGRKSPSAGSNTSVVDASEPGTPRSAQVGTAAAVAVNGAGAPGPRGPNNVHRVQLDFKPSMDDELELKSGQLVRMLHEYDDGWALCIRMDRSQQGVCPRTCLSKLPVKPRPQGPPGPNGRPMPPPGAQRGPSPPNAGNMVPRPLSPGQTRERSQTLSKTAPPQQQQGSPNSRNRSQSNAESGAMPSRKPVPGQAL